MTRGERICVLKEGRIQQVDTPTALYDRPANAFVASFIGSPPMNLLQQAPDTPAGRILGIRPEHIPLTSSGAGSNVTGQVQHLERLGDSSLLYVQMGEGQAVTTVKVEGSATTLAGASLSLCLMPEQLHLFDSQGMACDRTVALPN
jgi:ABC-type sugar transport system ATPase subunit